MKETLPKFWIEEKDYKDRTEFRIKIKDKYPKGYPIKGIYEDYMGEMIHSSIGGRTIHFCFIAYKHHCWLARLFGITYFNQKFEAIQKCNEKIKEFKQALELPRIHRVMTTADL